MARTLPPRVSAALAAALAFLVVTLAASPAAASMVQTNEHVTGPQSSPSYMRVAEGDGSYNGSRGVCSAQAINLDTSSLPVNRWSESMQFHSRLKASDWMTSAAGIQRKGILEAQLAVGNTIWASAAGMVEFATAFCVLDTVGGKVDRTAAKIGNALMSSGIMVGIVAFTVIVYMWRIGRGTGGGLSKTLVQKGLVIGLFGVMLAGAANSTGGGIGGSTAAYNPGVGSPGWVIVTVDQTVSSLAGTVASSIEFTQVSGADTVGEGGPMSCRRYVKALKNDYKQAYGKTIYEEAANTPLLLSSMWEQTGLEAWKKAQFGQDNEYGDWMYCRLLEEYAGQSGVDQIDVMRTVPALANSGFDFDKAERALAFTSSSSIKKRDRGLVGWAACDWQAGKAVLRDESVTKHAADADCKTFFGQDGTDVLDYDADAFDWDDSDDDLDQADAAEAKDFLLTLHGNKNAGGLVSMFIYSISAAMMWLVFGLFAGAIIVAKVAALVMMLLVFFALTAALLPNSSVGKVGDYLKQYVGISLFSFGAQFLLAILSLFTWILVDAGTTTMPGGAGGLMSMLWTGFAPLIALLVMHLGFKKMRMPSPISVSSGLGWGKAMAGGAAAGAAGGGVASLMNRGQEKAKQAVKARSQQALDAHRPGGKGRINKQAPKDTQPTADQSPAPTRAPGGRGAEEPATSTEPTTSGAGAPDQGGAEADSTATAAAGTGAPSERPAQASTPRRPDLDPMDEAEAARQARSERKAAAQWARTPEGSEAVEAARTRREDAQPTRRERARDRYAVASEQFRQKPLQTTKSGASAAAKHAKPAVKTAAVVGLGAVTLGPLGAGLAYGGWKAAQAANRRSAASRATEAEAYAEHMSQQRAQQAQQESEQQSQANGDVYAPTQDAADPEVGQPAGDRPSARRSQPVYRGYPDADGAGDGWSALDTAGQKTWIADQPEPVGAGPRPAQQQQQQTSTPRTSGADSHGSAPQI
ncbi:hypothetical protein [Nocardioides pakistanensis]